MLDLTIKTTIKLSYICDLIHEIYNSKD